MARGKRLPPARRTPASPVIQQAYLVDIGGYPAAVTITGQRLHENGWEERELICRRASTEAARRILDRLVVQT